MDTFKVGDTVKLKSGSPKMTVESIDNESNMVTCVWYCTTDCSVQIYKFQMATLDRS